MTFPASFTITNLRNRNLSLDAKFSEDRALRRSIPANGTLTLSGFEASVDELDGNAQIQQLISDGDITITMTQGPMVSFVFSVAADAGTDAAGVVLQSSMPFSMRLTQVLAEVPTGVASSTLTLADAASSGNAFTAAIDTDGTPAFVDAALTANRVIASGTTLYGQQSATAKPAVTLTLVGMRTSI